MTYDKIYQNRVTAEMHIKIFHNHSLKRYSFINLLELKYSKLSSFEKELKASSAFTNILAKVLNSVFDTRLNIAVSKLTYITFKDAG